MKERMLNGVQRTGMLGCSEKGSNINGRQVFIGKRWDTCGLPYVQPLSAYLFNKRGCSPTTSGRLQVSYFALLAVIGSSDCRAFREGLPLILRHVQVLRGRHVPYISNRQALQGQKQHFLQDLKTNRGPVQMRKKSIITPSCVIICETSFNRKNKNTLLDL